MFSYKIVSGVQVTVTADVVTVTAVVRGCCPVILVVTQNTKRMISLVDSKMKMPQTTANRFLFIAFNFRVRMYHWLYCLATFVLTWVLYFCMWYCACISILQLLHCTSTVYTARLQYCLDCAYFCSGSEPALLHDLLSLPISASRMQHVSDLAGSVDWCWITGVSQLGLSQTVGHA